MKKMPIIKSKIDLTAAEPDEAKSQDIAPKSDSDNAAPPVEASDSTPTVNSGDDGDKKKRNARLTTGITALTLLILFAGAVASIAFLFYTISGIAQADSSPEISDLSVVSVTDNSILLSWDCNKQVEQYAIRCVDENGALISEINSDIPFAALRDLSSETKYTVSVSAISDGEEYAAQSIVCGTSYFCAVTSVSASKITDTSAQISWEYSGVDEGFTVVVYALDVNGLRHLTSDAVTIEAGEKSSCTISGLLAGISYQAVVMPNTKFFEVNRTKFTAQDKPASYSKLTIVRSVICEPDETNMTKVNRLETVAAASEYKISMIVSGKATSTDTVEASVIIKNSNGVIVSEFPAGSVYTNPEGKKSYYQRLMLFSFTSPNEAGEYCAYVIFDGALAAKMQFEVEQ